MIANHSRQSQGLLEGRRGAEAMATAVTLAAPTGAGTVVEGAGLDPAVHSALHKENALENWGKIEGLIRGKQVRTIEGG